MISRFNIRVYFLLFDETRESVLVSDEIIKGQEYTKFPGGGLEFGEGTLDCALREAREELGQEIEILNHLYTTDFFLPSAFYANDQVVSIYYIAILKEPQKFRTSVQIHDFIQNVEDEESFRWVKKQDLILENWHFPADKVAMETLMHHEKG